jgi:hypothetical protein
MGSSILALVQARLNDCDNILILTTKTMHRPAINFKQIVIEFRNQ